jgi:uncharacterized protein YecT (DUF1311 family)
VLRVITITTAALIGAAVSAFAGDPGDPEATCDGSTYEMVECLKAKTAFWDKRMTAAYQATMKDAAPKQRDQLRAAQRLWIQYRDANCLYYGMGEGTMRAHRGRRMHAQNDGRSRARTRWLDREEIAPLFRRDLLRQPARDFVG